MSLPKSYNMLVTALEASTEVPQMDIVTAEPFLYEETKLDGRENPPKDPSELMLASRTD